MRDLELEEDPSLEKKLERVRIAGWSLFSLILIAGLFGLLGKGPLSKRRVGDDSTWVQYNRFDHHRSPTRIIIGFDADNTETFPVFIGRSYLDRVSISKITPAPLRTEISADGLVFVFGLRRDATAGRVIFDLEAIDFGTAKGLFRIGSKTAPLLIEQLFYP
jgi:hypothetical protein